MTDFLNMMVRVITKAEEIAKININVLSSSKVYHSIIMYAYIWFQDGFTNYDLNGRELL